MRNLVLTSSLFALFSSCQVLQDTTATNTSAIQYYLPKTLLELEIKSIKSTAGALSNPEITINTVDVPDQSQSYYYRYRRNIFSKDEVKVEFTDNHLLDKISSATESRAGVTFTKVGELAVELAKFGSIPSAAVGEEEVIYKAIFDPMTANSITRVNSDLTGHPEFGSMNLRIYLNPITNSANLSSLTSASTFSPTANSNDGIKYRTSLPHELTVISLNSATPTSSRVFIRTLVNLPGDQIGNIQVRRTAFAKEIKEITFKNGYLKSVSVNNESEAEGFIDIPLDLVKKIISIPSEIVQFKIDTSSKNKELLEMQKQLLEAQKALEEAQEDGEPEEN